jgi:cellulose synthase/poly-beta-1,6-N-acetylglucosamine synthase-like glycosyltransferase
VSGGVLHLLLVISQCGLLAFFLAMNGTGLALVAGAWFAARRYLGEVEADRFEDSFESAHSKPVTVICPVRDEQAGVVARVNGLLGLHYPDFQVIVVNDGSSDGTLANLVEAFRLRPSAKVVRTQLATLPVRAIYESAFLPRLVVVDKDDGGRADALNCGLNLARFPLVCSVEDGWTVENDALLRASRPFLDRPDVVATAGAVRPLNGCQATPAGVRETGLPRAWLARMQLVEHLRTFLLGRMGLAGLGGLFLLDGAFSVFRKDLLLEAGGYRPALGEDVELMVRLHGHLRRQGRPCQVVMVPDPLAWAAVPEAAGALGRRRRRWQRVLLDVLWRHRDMWFNPDCGRVGTLALPYVLLFEAAAPALELAGWILFAVALAAHRLYGPFAVAFCLTGPVLGVAVNLAAILVEQAALHPYARLRDWLKLLGCGVAEGLVYRQVTIVWRVRGIVDWVRGQGGTRA